TSSNPDPLESGPAASRRPGMATESNSEIELQQRVERARDADHHGLAACLLSIAQDLVAMVRTSRQHGRFAGAAGALTAGEGRHQAGAFDCFEDRLVRADLDRLAGTAEPDSE